MAAGSLSLKDALLLVSKRGQIMHEAAYKLDRTWSMVALLLLNSVNSFDALVKEISQFQKHSMDSSTEVAEISNFNSLKQV